MSVIWMQEPPFPEGDLAYGTVRYQIGAFWVDWNEPGVPTEALITDRLAANRIRSAAELV